MSEFEFSDNGEFEIKDRTEPRPVQVSKEVGSQRVHLHQLVADEDGIHYLVSGFTENGVKLQAADFSTSPFEVDDLGNYDPKTAKDDTPVFAY